jgi:hypothetical protein
MSSQRYRLVVKGELGARYASAFEGMTVRAHHGITDISGVIIDSSHLHGLIDRIASLGLTLRSVTTLDADNGEEAALNSHMRNPTDHDQPNIGSPGRF